MSSQKSTKSLNSYAQHFVKIGFNLPRRENLVFYKLLGFLIRNDKPFPYSNEKLSANTLYKITSVKEALNNLENIGLITRIGFSYKRRFTKGLSLVNILSHSRYCIELDLKDNCTQGRLPACTSRFSACTSQLSARIERNKTRENVKKPFADASNQPQNQEPPQTPVNWEYREYCKRIENDIKLGLESGNVLILSEQEWMKANQ